MGGEHGSQQPGRPRACVGPGPPEGATQAASRPSPDGAESGRKFMARGGLSCPGLPIRSCRAGGQRWPHEQQSRVTSRPPVLETPRGWGPSAPQGTKRGPCGLRSRRQGCAHGRGSHGPQKKCMAPSQGHGLLFGAPLSSASSVLGAVTSRTFSSSSGDPVLHVSFVLSKLGPRSCDVSFPTLPPASETFSVDAAPPRPCCPGVRVRVCVYARVRVHTSAGSRGCL